MENIKQIKDIENLQGKRVLLRADFNVPVVEGKILDTYRIDKAISTIDFLRHKKAKIIIISHIESDEKTLLPVWDYLKGFFPVKFSKDYFTKEADKFLNDLKEGEVLIFENLRENSGEKENDQGFAEKLSKYADLYVNDAFSVSHRKHASVVSVPKLLPSYAGPLFMEEVNNLAKVFNPNHPFLFILGGAKFSTKVPLVNKFLNLADKIFICGALANDVFKAKGFEVGKSLVSSEDFGLIEILEKAGDKIEYPKDVCVLMDDKNRINKDLNNIDSGDYIADIGDDSLKKIKDLAKNSKFILWNGPTGNYEIGFKEKTEELAKFLAELKSDGTEIIVGGGDTVSSIQNLNILDKFTFVSTAGGAMLDFLANETLPGIEALQ